MAAHKIMLSRYKDDSVVLRNSPWEEFYNCTEDEFAKIPVQNCVFEKQIDSDISGRDGTYTIVS